MFEAIRSYMPVEWRRPFEFAAAPLWWIPEWQVIVLDFVFSGANVGVLLAKGVGILLPACLLIVGTWSTMLGLYTVPFRSDRRRFLTSLLLAWWDAGRSIWLFWAGLFRFVVLLVGWAWGILQLAWRLTVGTVKSLVASPMRFADWSTRHYFQPGVPWLAFLLTLGWSALEATIFTFTLSPTMQEVLVGITGLVPSPAFMLPILWIFLFFLIAGSFACLQVLSEAVQKKEVAQIIEMTFVELFVMFFEVVFLYRELIDAITPWIAQQTAGEVQLGLWSTLAIASFGWIGIRGMTWFLFARFGTPALLAVLSRETMEGHDRELAPTTEEAAALWSEPIEALQAEAEWFRAEAKRAFELITLPVLQLFAAAVN
ncbi:MAG TPA: hypothetical protein VLL48_05040, partial [Longimicrobiales bacterium]|nr:hypothetical protein [Longimicrobiales bacterium]